MDAKVEKRPQEPSPRRGPDPPRSERPPGGPSPPAEQTRPITEADKPSRWERIRRRAPILLAIAVVLILAAIAGTLWWRYASQFESTDDAFISARTVPISPEITGLITDVPVTDNQLVTRGAVLLRIDDRDYRARRDQARAQADQAVADIASLDAQIAAQQAKVDQTNTDIAAAQAALDFSRSENQRAQDLLRQGTDTREQAQQATSDLAQKQATLDSDIAAKTSAEKQIAVLKADRDSAVAQRAVSEAAVALAETSLARTVIAAPIAGRVTNLSAAKGALAQPGQPVMIFVPVDIWITANFKETQLREMHVGQPVDIAVDAYPGRSFKGHVDSIQAGSGAAFSLLPPENATGNYVKVVQRIPVKIVFDRPPDVFLGPGMSVVPTVRVQ